MIPADFVKILTKAEFGDFLTILPNNLPYGQNCYPKPKLVPNGHKRGAFLNNF